MIAAVSSGAADIAFCLPQRVPVYLHDTTGSVVERRVNEHTDNIFMLPQNIIRGAPYDNARTVVGDAADDPVLRRDGPLDHLRAEIEIAHRVRSVFVDIGNEFAVESALMRGQRHHLLVVKRDAELLRNEISDLLAGGAVLAGDGDDDARLRGFERHGVSVIRAQRLRLADIVLFEELPVEYKSYECRFSCLRRFRAGLASRLYRGRRAEPDLSAAYHQADRRSYGCGFGASADKTIRREFPGFVNTAFPNYPTYRQKNAARFCKPRRILLLFLN